MPRSRPLRRAALAATLLVAMFAVAPAQAQEREPDAFRYAATMARGRTVHLHNINGSIEVERSSGTELEIRAEKRWRRGDPEDVRITRIAGANGDVIVCALWDEAECTEAGIQSRRNRNWNNRNDVAVHFTVRVPDGVNVTLKTVNGGVTAEGLTGTVTATTVNGSIIARSTGGPVHAKTVNGSIRATMGAIGSDDLRYETVNGGITLELPTNANADLDLSTVNGGVSTDFPVTVQGTISRKRLRGSVGDGGRLLKASTVNGGISLKRAN
jgi:DUF4097 and DUF4098 domain-containing protein YvlB